MREALWSAAVDAALSDDGVVMNTLSRADIDSCFLRLCAPTDM